MRNESRVAEVDPRRLFPCEIAKSDALYLTIPSRVYGGFVMLETIIIVLLVLWLLGAFITPIPAIGGFIHLLLVVVLVVVVIRVLQGRRAIPD
jgi:Family of unknown function (DUF5670)